MRCHAEDIYGILECSQRTNCYTYHSTVRVARLFGTSALQVAPSASVPAAVTTTIRCIAVDELLLAVQYKIDVCELLMGSYSTYLKRIFVFAVFLHLLNSSGAMVAKAQQLPH